MYKFTNTPEICFWFTVLWNHKVFWGYVIRNSVFCYASSLFVLFSINIIYLYKYEISNICFLYSFDCNGNICFSTFTSAFCCSFSSATCKKSHFSVAPFHQVNVFPTAIWQKIYVSLPENRAGANQRGRCRSFLANSSVTVRNVQCVCVCVCVMLYVKSIFHYFTFEECVCAMRLHVVGMCW